MRKRVAILISGGGSNMVALLRDMAGEHPAEPVLVLSNVPGAGGLQKASAMGIATAVVDHRDFPGDRPGFEAALIGELDAVQPDIICLAGFMRVLTAKFVQHYQGRILNIHPSLLPRYKGLHTHERALKAGDDQHGCSVHLVTPDLDAGPILGQAGIVVRPDDTAETLAARVLEREHILYPAVLRRFAVGDLSPLKVP
ncbi:MAG: phosphoribosylglycinamide formyltransferase [Rhodobacter sp.]|nr:phosphoribosylglycinamide formyltransferase [Rhodobacter sp.]